MPEPHVYDDRPDAEVWVDDEAGGTWWPAELRMRTERANGFEYNAAWHRDGDTYLDNFPADQVRLDTVDRAQGRG
jgi:hypothetical protein